MPSAETPKSTQDSATDSLTGDAAVISSAATDGADAHAQVSVGSPPPHLSFKPTLRGASHAVAVWIAAVSVAVLVVRSTPGVERFASIVYALCICAMFGVSATYHRLTWSERSHLLMNRLDHCTIFLAIAGSYTPLSIGVLHGWQRTTVLIVVWVGAAIGISIQWLTKRVPRWFETLVYAVVGWVVVIAAPQFLSQVSTSNLVLVALGGLAYTLGAVVYAFRWPNPWPKTFGFHEVFHALTIVGAGCHFAAIWRIVG